MLHWMIEIVVSSSLMIIVLLLTRILWDGKLNPKWQYALWALVLLRLLVPVSLPQNKVNVVPQRVADTVQSIGEHRVALPDFSQAQNKQGAQESSAQEDNLVQSPEMKDEGFAKTAPAVSVTTVAALIWGTGTFFVLLYMGLINLRFVRFLKQHQGCISKNAEAILWETAVQLNLKKYPVLFVCNQQFPPCLYGLFQPKIILNSSTLADEQALRHIMMHELIHYKQRDYVLAMLRNLCCAIYWFNPFVWLGAAAARQDAETSCDARVIQYFNREEQLSYAETLIKLAGQKASPPAALRSAATISTGKRKMKQRISLIIQQPRKTIIWFAVTVAVALAVCLTAFFTIPGINKKQESNAKMDLTGYTYEQLEKVQRNKTPYIGNNSNTGAMIGELPVSCKGMAVDSFSLQTNREPYGLTINYKEAGDGLLDQSDFIYDNPYRNSIDENNAFLLFAAIGNLSEITFAMPDMEQKTYTRQQIEAVYGEIPPIDDIKIENLKIEEAYFAHASRYYLVKTTPDYLITREGRQPDQTVELQNGLRVYQYDNAYFYFSDSGLYAIKYTGNQETYEALVTKLGAPDTEKMEGELKYISYRLHSGLSDNTAEKRAYFLLKGNQVVESGLMAGDDFTMLHMEV